MYPFLKINGKYDENNNLLISVNNREYYELKLYMDSKYYKKYDLRIRNKNLRTIIRREINKIEVFRKYDIIKDNINTSKLYEEILIFICVKFNWNNKLFRKLIKKNNDKAGFNIKCALKNLYPDKGLPRLYGDKTNRYTETNGLYHKFTNTPVPTGYHRHHIIPYKTCMHYFKETGDEKYLELACDGVNNRIDIPKDVHVKLHKELSARGYNKCNIVPECEFSTLKSMTLEIIKSLS